MRGRPARLGSGAAPSPTPEAPAVVAITPVRMDVDDEAPPDSLGDDIPAGQLTPVRMDSELPDSGRDVNNMARSRDPYAHLGT